MPLNEHSPHRPADTAQEASRTSHRESLVDPEAEAILAGLASALFPAGAGNLDQVTWPDAAKQQPVQTVQTPVEVAETRRRAAELRYRTLVEQIPAVTFMAVLGEGENEIYVNPYIEALLGFTQRQWLENPFLWYSQLHPDDRALWNEEFARGCRTGGPFRAECRFIARDGRIVWVRGEVKLVKDEQGRPSFLQGVAFDITESKRVEAVVLRQAVQRTEERYRDLVERLGAIFWEADAGSGGFTFVSRGAEQILQFPLDHWLADPQFWIRQVHSDEREAVATVWRKALDSGGDHEFEFRATASDGRLVWLHTTMRAPHAADKDRRVLGLILDVTERKRTEAELARVLAAQQAEMLLQRHNAEVEGQRLKIFRATMTTVQDIVNNFLSNMQLIRLEAEDHLSEETLALFDQLIQDAATELKLLGDLETIREKQMAIGTGIEYPRPQTD